MNITIYSDGNEFLIRNKSFLDQNKLENIFFYLDAPLLKEQNENNYCIEINDGDKKFVACKVEPYNALLFGDEELIEDFVDFVFLHGYRLKNFYCRSTIGEKMMTILKERNHEYFCALTMDSMISKEKTIPSVEFVEKATENDIDELFELNKAFAIECGLIDEIVKENVKKQINNYRIIRKDNKIVSLAKRSNSTDDDVRISTVYTRKEYRGKGYAKDIVNNLKNEIIDEGKIATLNVDVKNPVSNHIYSSIGFEKSFTQGEYRRR